MECPSARVRFLRSSLAMLTIVSIVLAGLVVGLLVLVGLMSAVQGTPVCVVTAMEGCSVPGVTDPGFRCAVELLSKAPLAPGHQGELFVNGDETYPRLW